MVGESRAQNKQSMATHRSQPTELQKDRMGFNHGVGRGKPEHPAQLLLQKSSGHGGLIHIWKCTSYVQEKNFV